MLIDNYRHIFFLTFTKTSANMLSVNFSVGRDVTHFLADYKGAEARQPSQPKIYVQV